MRRGPALVVWAITEDRECAREVDEYLTGFENLDMVGRLYHLGKEASRARARELLEQFDLAEAADRPVKTYSGGMRRRLDLAGALVARSPVLFLDEPTTGLDPIRSDSINDLIIQLREELGVASITITHDMISAYKIADRITMLYKGKLIATGTVEEIRGSDNPYVQQFIHGKAEGPIRDE